MNNHISACRLGKSTDVFDNHVHKCCYYNNSNNEPFFKLTVMMEVNDVNKLLTYEKAFHQKGYDTINRTRAKIQFVQIPSIIE